MCRRSSERGVSCLLSQRSCVDYRRRRLQFIDAVSKVQRDPSSNRSRRADGILTSTAGFYTHDVYKLVLCSQVHAQRIHKSFERSIEPVSISRQLAVGKPSSKDTKFSTDMFQSKPDFRFAETESLCWTIGRRDTFRLFLEPWFEMTHQPRATPRRACFIELRSVTGRDRHASREGEQLVRQQRPMCARAFRYIPTARP